MDKADELLPPSELISLSVELASAYVSNNSVPANELPKLLAEIHGVLRGLNTEAPAAPVEEKLSPAVPVKKSVTPEFIICLEDGKSFKSLKRHLQTQYGLSPQQYRQKWNLPADYPMVAPSYAAARSALARASGLGQTRAAAAMASTKIVAENPAPSAVGHPPEASPKKRGGRPAKAADFEATGKSAQPKATATPASSSKASRVSSKAVPEKPKRAPRRSLKK